MFSISAFSSEIADKYFEQLENLDVVNKSQIIMVSGVPGMGRTTLTKRLAKDFKGVYISSDQVRKLSGKKNVSEIMKEVGSKVFKESDNHRIIVDGGMSAITRLSKTKRSKEIIVIRLEAPRKQVEERIQRSKPNPDDYFKFLDHWYGIYEGVKDMDFDFVFDSSNEHFNTSYEKLTNQLFKGDLQD